MLIVELVFCKIKHKEREDKEIRRRIEVRKKNNRILLENGILGMYWLAVMSKFEVYKHITDNYSSHLLFLSSYSRSTFCVSLRIN